MPRTVLITGANRGIGFCIAQAHFKRAPEDELIIAARSAEKAETAIGELRKVGVTTKLFALALDLSSDASIKAAAQTIEQKYGKLDVLVNNAAIAARVPPEEIDNLRSTFNSIFDTNVSGVAVTTSVFLPLLSRSADPRVINVSSAVGSITRPIYLPTPSLSPYSISKTAENVLTLQFQKVCPQVLFQTTNPGYCKTGLNGFQGPRDPLNGAAVVVELSIAPRDKYQSGFWEMDDGATECSPVPW